MKSKGRKNVRVGAEPESELNRSSRRNSELGSVESDPEPKDIFTAPQHWTQKFWDTTHFITLW
jgi:hypothetical protein